MPRPASIFALIAAAALAAGAWTVGGGADAAIAAHHPLVTAVSYTGVEGGSTTQNDLALRRIVAAGATAFRFTLDWSAVAPAKRRSGFHAADPGDPQYDWASVDQSIKALVAHHLEPIVSIIDTPKWAYMPGTAVPDPAKLALFARAAARRYSGSFQGLPRVRYWEVWLEPNLTPLLGPQFYNGKPFAAVIYRRMINAFAAPVHAAAPGNLVIAGGTAPFRDISPQVMAVDKDWGPLSFTRAVLCLSASNKPTCDEPVHADIWAHDPYTSGGPTHHAALPNDVSLGDLGKLRAVLDAAVAAGHIISKGTLQLWVSEFSWDTNPPDPGGVPTELAARWVAQAVYQVWRNGFSLLTWLQLRDKPMTQYEQAGLYYRGPTLAADRPKPLLQAFRFPVVAFPRASGVYVWGRTPAGVPGTVIVQQQSTGSRWRAIGTVATDQYGIFQQTFHTGTKGWVRARFEGGFSRPFSLTAVPDHAYNPFGSQESSAAAGHR